MKEREGGKDGFGRYEGHGWLSWYFRPLPKRREGTASIERDAKGDSEADRVRLLSDMAGLLKRKLNGQEGQQAASR